MDRLPIGSDIRISQKENASTEKGNLSNFIKEEKSVLTRYSEHQRERSWDARGGRLGKYTVSSGVISYIDFSGRAQL